MLWLFFFNFVLGIKIRGFNIYCASVLYPCAGDLVSLLCVAYGVHHPPHILVYLYSVLNIRSTSRKQKKYRGVLGQVWQQIIKKDNKAACVKQKQQHDDVVVD